MGTGNFPCPRCHYFTQVLSPSQLFKFDQLFKFFLPIIPLSLDSLSWILALTLSMVSEDLTSSIASCWVSIRHPCGVTLCDIIWKARVKITDRLLQSSVGRFIWSKKWEVYLIHIQRYCMTQIKQKRRDVANRKSTSELFEKLGDSKRLESLEPDPFCLRNYLWSGKSKTVTTPP